MIANERIDLFRSEEKLRILHTEYDSYEQNKMHFFLAEAIFASEKLICALEKL